MVQKQNAQLIKPATLMLALLTVSELNWAEPAYSQLTMSNRSVVSARFVTVPRNLQKRMREAKEVTGWFGSQVLS